MCKKIDCPLYDTCDKENDQALYCRKVELMLHLWRMEKSRKPRANYVKVTELSILH